MGKYFAAPVKWDKAMAAPVTDNENRMSITHPAGSIEARAMREGFVIFRPAGAAPVVKGTVELVFLPDKWHDALKRFFNGDKWTELPPGRIVYLGVPVSAVKRGLHKLILDSYTAYRGGARPHHPCLEFVPKEIPAPAPSVLILLDVIQNSAASVANKKKKIDEEIDAALDVFLAESSKDTFRGLKVNKGDLLFTSDQPNAQVTLEMRNLYGEPLHPHFYLRRLGDTATELAPEAPNGPFPAVPPDDEHHPPARKDGTPGAPMLVRSPARGGIEYSLLGYSSRLVWHYDFNPTPPTFGGGVDARPGANVTIPVMHNVQPLVQKTWDANFSYINTYARKFQVPCEVLVALIFVESRKELDYPDLHSIHLEPFGAETGPYPADYELLLARTKVGGSVLKKAAVDSYWLTTGGWRSNENKMARPPELRKIQPLKQRQITVQGPFKLADPIGLKSLKMTWAQLAEVVDVNPNLVSAQPIEFPPFAKTKNGAQFHYDLVKKAQDLGDDVARIYWLSVGGVRLNAGKEELQQATSLVAVPPVKPAEVLMADPNNTNLTVTWSQVLSILKILKDGPVVPPTVTYTLEPLGSSGTYLYERLYLDEGLKRKMPAATQVQIDDIIDRYLALMEMGIRFSAHVGPSNLPGVELDVAAPPAAKYLTLEELRPISELIPHRISIGVNQALFSTAAIAIQWITQHYGANFFQNAVPGTPNPVGNLEALVGWMWDNAWDNVEIQIILLAGLVKRNAVYYWEAAKGYRIGERMTMYDFPRIACSYNSNVVQKPTKENPKPNNEHFSDWGLNFYDNYLSEKKQGWSALLYASSIFSLLPPGDPKEALVLLRPDIEPDTGMDTR